jgi:hypothetical protein
MPAEASCLAPFAGTPAIGAWLGAFTSPADKSIRAVSVGQGHAPRSVQLHGNGKLFRAYGAVASGAPRPGVPGHWDAPATSIG